MAHGRVPHMWRDVKVEGWRVGRDSSWFPLPSPSPDSLVLARPLPVGLRGILMGLPIMGMNEGSEMEKWGNLTDLHDLSWRYPRPPAPRLSSFP